MKVIKRKGSFVQYEDQSWGIDTKVKISGEFKHFGKKGYVTLSAVKADFERAKEEFILANTKHHKPVTYEELTKEYLEMRAITVARSTTYMTKSVLNAYFKPDFANKMIKDFIKRDIIKAWHLRVANKPNIGGKRKNVIISIMKDLIKYAYNNEYIDPTVYQGCDVCLLKVKEKQSEKKERIAWSQKELFDFYSVIPEGSVDYIMFKLFFTCAPRISEFIALMPSCYDSKKRRISIHQQVTYSYDRTKTPVLTDRLKTKESYRTILLPENLAQMLEKYIRDFDIKPDEYLFCGRNGRTYPLGKTSFKRKLDHYCDLAGVRRINPHGARHTMAVLWAAASVTGVDIQVAAKRLGHSPEMFMNTYANHKNEEKEEDLLNKVGLA